MAPNLIRRAGHSYDSVNSGNATASRPTFVRTKSRVRTEFIVSNVFYYLLEDYGYQEQQEDISASNPVEEEVLEAFKKVVTEFKMGYGEKLIDICTQLQFTAENVKGVYLGVINELFSEGITWARICALFVFSSELAIQSLRKELPDATVEEILDCCLGFVHNSLEEWVKDHGGWEGISIFSKGLKSTDSQQSSSTQNHSWAKSVLHGTVRLVGTLAHIANSTGAIMALPMHNVRM